MFIAGAGPSGVAVAVRLRRLGYDVALAAPGFCPAHGFETLTAATQQQLAIEGLPVPRGREVAFEICWGGTDFEPRVGVSRSLVVDRRAFHVALLRHAIGAGVRVFETPMAIEEGWRVGTAGGRDARGPNCAIFVDATGRRGLTRARRRAAPLIGLHAVFRGEGLPGTARVAAAREAWAWGAPTPDSGYAVSVFEDPRSGRGGDPATRIARALAETRLLEGSAVAATVTASDATASTAAPFEAPTLFRIGDACLALDPLSSSGVSAALQSAVDAALAIHTLRERPEAAAMVEAFVNRRTRRRAARHAAWTGAFYAEAATVFPTPFWTARAVTAPAPRRVVPISLDAPVALGPGVRVQDEPCPVGDGVAMRRVVVLPGAAEPVAFVEGVEVAPLLDRLHEVATVRETLALWAKCVGLGKSERLFGSAWRSGMIASGERSSAGAWKHPASNDA